MRVLGNRILVEIKEEKSESIVTPGGIHLSSESEAAKIEIGLKVIGVGSEVEGIKIGDRVLLEPRLNSATMRVEEGLVLFVHVANVLCVL